MSSLTKTLKNQKGFTLVEIAIVLVIIGLLLGGVMKGQELITSSKVKSAVKDLDGVTAAYQGYVDRYHQLPGDDGPLATLTARGTAWTMTAATAVPDGVITNASAATFTGAAATEGLYFWQQLKAAGFIAGNPATTAAAALPRNAFGGLIGVTSVLVMPAAAGGLTGTKVCMSQVPGKAALAMDTQLDDGLPNSGTIRVTDGVAGANTPPGAISAVATYNEDNTYTLCRPL